MMPKSITSRTKQPIESVTPHRRDANIIYIATEGENTEKHYFELPIFMNNHRVKVIVLSTGEDGYSAPQHVIHRLHNDPNIKYVQPQPDDEYWLVIDKDRWTEQKISEVCSMARRGKHGKKTQVAISNPCFEMWLYLHHAEWTDGSIIPKILKQRLHKLTKGRGLSQFDKESVNEMIDAAIVRAKTNDPTNGLYWPDNPGTRVYQVVEAIRTRQKK